MVEKVEDYIKQMANNYPEVSKEIWDCYEIFLTELKDDDSIQFEADLCFSSVNEIIANYLDSQ